jgi:hypothetical protein
VSIAIDSMTPQTARPGSHGHRGGTVSNGTSQTKAGLDVQLWTSPARFATRDGMDSFLSQGVDASLAAGGQPVLLAASLTKPGATASGAPRSGQHRGHDAVRRLPGQRPAAGHRRRRAHLAQTLLPFWPGQRAAGLERPLNISWLWPLVDQPHHQVCSALTNNDLTTSLRPGGRLSTLLTAGVSHPTPT